MVNGDCGLHDCMKTKKVGDGMRAMAMYDDVPVICEVGWLHVNATMGARLWYTGNMRGTLVDFAVTCLL